MKSDIVLDETIFLDFIENTEDLIQCLDANNNFVYVNKKWKQTLGHKETSILKAWDIIEKKEIIRYKQILKQVKEGKYIKSFQTTFITKGGKEIFVDGNISPVFQKGKFLSIAIFRDITTQKLEHQFFTGLWDNAPVAYHRLNTKGVIVDANETEAKMLGYKKQDMIGKPIFNFILPEQRNHAKKKI